MTNQTKNNVRKSRKGPRIQHLFQGIREPLLTNTGDNSVAFLSTGADGNGSFTSVLSPAGLATVAISGSSFVNQGVENPHLKWLNNQSGNFTHYRVTRCKLIFVGNLGTTVTGQVNVFASADVMDAGIGINTAFVSGPGAKTFDLATAGGKEQVLNLPIDSSWKKVSSKLAVPANMAPFQLGTVGGIIPVNTANDLAFVAFSLQCVGGPVSATRLGVFFIDYDVEFKNPLSHAMNT